LVVLLNGGDSGGPPASSAGPLDYVARVDPATGKVASRIGLTGSHPIDMAVGEGSVWVLDADGSVARIDPVSGNVNVIDVGAKDPQSIAVGEGSAWVADGNGSLVRRIDAATNRVGEPIASSGFAKDVTVARGLVWVLGSVAIDHIDPATGRSSVFAPNPIPLAALGGPEQSAFIGVAGPYVWVAPVQFNILYPVVVETAESAREVDVGFAMRDMVADGDSVWSATCGTPGSVAQVDPSGQVTTLAAGAAVCDYLGIAGTPVSIDAGTEGVWVVDSVNGTVARIQVATNQVDTPIRIGDTPTAVAVGLGSVWVAVDGSSAGSPSASPTS